MPKKLKPLEQYTDEEINALSERDKAQLESEALYRIQQQTQEREKERQAEIEYTQKAIFEHLSDKDLAEIEKARPEEVFDIRSGKLPASLKKEEFSPDMSMWSRWKISNLGGLYDERTRMKMWGVDGGDENNPENFRKLKEQLGKEFFVVKDEGRIWLKAKNSKTSEAKKYWYPLDQNPSSNIPKALATVVAPTIFGAATGYLLGGPGALATGTIGGAYTGISLMKEELSKLDWNKEKENIKHFLRDLPSDVSDVFWENFIAAPIETAAGVAGALAGIPVGAPMVTAVLGTAVTGGLLEGVRQKIGNELGYKQKLNMSDLLATGALGGVATYLLGPGVSDKLIAKRVAPLVDKMAKKEIPQLKFLGTTAYPTEQEKNAIMELAPFARNFEEAGEQIKKNFEKDLIERNKYMLKGAIPKVYEGLTRGMAVKTAGLISKTPPEAYLNFFRNPKRMLEMDRNSGKIAGQVGRDLIGITEERTASTGKEWGDFLKKYDEKRVDVGPTSFPIAERIAELDQKYAQTGLVGEEKRERDMLLKIQNDFFVKTKPDGTQYPRESLLTPYEAKEFKNEMNQYARWDVADVNAIANPLERQKIREARKIYFKVNDLIDNSFDKSELKKQAQQLRKNNELAHLQEGFVKAVFHEKDTAGNPMFDQLSYNILSNPTSKSNIILTDLVKEIDNWKGLSGPDSYIQKMNDLYAHSYLGSPGSGGYSRVGDTSMGASTIGSVVAGSARAAELSGQIGYGVGKAAGLELVKPKTIMSYMNRAINTEDFIGNVLSLTGKDKKLFGGRLPVGQTQAQALINIFKPKSEEINPWTEMQRPEPQIEAPISSLPGIVDPSTATNQQYLNQATP